MTREHAQIKGAATAPNAAPPTHRPPEERVTSPQTPQLVDARRAASLVVHWNRQDVEGVNDVLAQVNVESDPNAASARLLFATLEMYAGLIPLLHTPAGLGLLTQMIVDLSRADLGTER